MTERTPPQLSERTRKIEPTAIRYMYSLAEAQGGDLVRLEIGEPDFDTPGHIIDHAAEAAHGGATHYTSNAGAIEFREAVAEKSARDHDLDVDPENVVAVAGASEAILLVFLATTDFGDEIVLPTPAWPQYDMQIGFAGAETVEVPLSPEDDFALDADAVIEAINDDTGCVVVNSPSNPTGRIYEPEPVRAVAEAAADHGAYVLLDEVYSGLDFEERGRSLASELDTGNVGLINACLKEHAMTGWRLGWLVGPDPLIDAAIKLHPGTTASPSSVSQHAGVAALTGTQEPIEEMYEAFRERRDYVHDRIESMPVVSAPYTQGSFYAFLDVRELEGTCGEIAERLLADYEVVTVPGGGLGSGGEGFLRLSFANSLDRLELGLDRIERMVRDEQA